jgi:uncharacterized membrane protein
MNVLYYKPQLIASVTLLVLDILWLKVFMGPKYAQLIPKIQGSQIQLNAYSAMGAYVLMLVTLVNIVIKYKLSYLDTFILGFCLYGVYDLTCGAIFKNWDFQLALIDMVWGGLVYVMAIYVSKLFGV